MTDDSNFSHIEPTISVAYLLSYPDDTDMGDQPMLLRFGSLNEVYSFITEEKLTVFRIDKVVKTLVTHRP